MSYQNKTVLALAALVFSTSVFAFPLASKPCNQSGSDKALNDLVTNLNYDPVKDKPNTEKAMFMDGEDRRDYMSANVQSDSLLKKIDLSDNEMNNFMHTSGVLHCESVIPGETVTSTADLESSGSIRTPKHAMKQAKLGSCKFMTYAKKESGINFSDANKTDFNKWVEGGEKFVGDDIVLSLASPIPLPEGVSIPKTASWNFKVFPGDKLLVVSAPQRDWRKKRKIKKLDLKEPLAYNCDAQTPYENDTGFQTNCAIDDEGSGAKVYARRGGELFKVGMLVSSRNQVRGSKVIIKDGSPYDSNSMYSSALAINRNATVSDAGPITNNTQSN